MEFVEYGKEHSQTIVLLHGGGLSWWNFREAAQLLSDEYRVLLPILDGHGQSDADFTTMQANADEILDFIGQYIGSSVLLLGGLSLGGQVLLEILARRKDICRYALIESTLVRPSGLTHALIKPLFGSCWGLIRRRWFAKLQFRALGIQPALFEEYYRDTCRISKENMIAFLQANALYDIKPSLKDCGAKAYIFVGKKENRAMKLSAEKLGRSLPGSVLQLLPGGHGDFSLNRAEDYARTVREIIKRG